MSIHEPRSSRAWLVRPETGEWAEFEPGSITPVADMGSILTARPGGLVNLKMPSAEAIRNHELLWENT